MSRHRRLLAYCGLAVASLALLVGPGRERLLEFQTKSVVSEHVVAQRALVVWAEATGMLRATSVQHFGAPPAFGHYWRFQIASMIPDGQLARKGDVLIQFEAQKINEDLERLRTELDSAIKTLERTRTRVELEQKDLLWRLAAAENTYEKFKLRQGISAAIEASSKIELDALALEQARREYAAIQERLEWHKRSSDASTRIVASRKSQAEQRVEQIVRGVERFEVRADRDGVVVYRVKWNGEKYKAGETAWSGEPIMEIPDLDTLVAEAFLPEVDIGKVRPGQRVEITVDAFPGKRYSGTVRRLGTLVHSKAYDIPNKVLDVEVALDRLDTTIMRPAMSIRARIEAASVPDCLTVPLSAVHTSAAGARVRLRSASGWEDQPVVLGASNGADVVVVRGLDAGDRIAADYAAVR